MQICWRKKISFVKKGEKVNKKEYDDETITADKILIATGTSHIFQISKALNHLVI